MKKLIIFLLAAIILNACSPYVLPPGPDACSLGWEECNRLATQQACEKQGGSSQDCFAQSTTSSSAELGGPPDQEGEPLVVVEKPEEITELSDLEAFKLSLKKALEASDFETLDKLIIPDSKGKFVTGAYEVGGTSLSHKEALEEFWNLSPINVDISERGEILYQTLEKPAPIWGDWIVLALWDNESNPMILSITQVNGYYYWNGFLTIPCSQITEKSLQFCQALGFKAKQSGIIVEFNLYDDFVNGIALALRYNDLDLFLKLLHEPWYQHQCVSAGCGLGAVEKTQKEGVEIFLMIHEWHDLSEIEVVDQKSDLGCFAIDPVSAEYAVLIPIDYGLRIGFANIGDRYYITDIWWEIQ